MLAGHFEIKHFRDKSASLGFGIKMLHFNLEFYLMIFSFSRKYMESTWSRENFLFLETKVHWEPRFTISLSSLIKGSF